MRTRQRAATRSAAARLGMRTLAVLLVAAVLALCTPAARAADTGDAISTAVVKVKESDTVFYGSSAADADWGGELPSEKMHGNSKRRFFRFYYHSGAFTDRFGCTSMQTLSAQQANGSAALALPDAPFVLVVDRGLCGYAEKAFYAQQLGASALIVTDTLEQIANRTLVARTDASLSDSKRSELLGMEFSCARGNGEAGSDVSEAALRDISAPTWSQLPNVTSCTSASTCESQLCIPTGVGRQVCCAWDIPDAMGFGDFVVHGDRTNITIPVVRLTATDGATLKALLAAAPSSLLTLFARRVPAADPSQFLIWLLAVATVLLGGYKGAAYERTKAQLKAALVTTDATSSDATAQARVAFQEHEDAAATEDVMDLTLVHAVGFLVVGSAFLLLLFYVDVVLVLVVAFAIGAVSCTFQELWGPLCNAVKPLRYRPFEHCQWQSTYLLPALWTLGDVVALVAAIAASVLWFVTRHADHAWVFQDAFGICFCVLFLKTVRLPNLRIATALLVLVFCYDVFMVFVSPLVFHESVMIKAATGGSQADATASAGFCLRYPLETAHGCRKEKMPILLRLPKLLDWRNGYSMLGLGDIVLPGLLLVLCARYDYATRGQLYGKVQPHLARIKSFRSVDARRRSGANSSAELAAAGSAGARRGLFGLLIWGYALGLFLANVAVVVMQQGQPALMYIVPCTLGPMTLLAWRRGILAKLWDGPPELAPGFNSGVALDPTRASSLRASAASFERGDMRMHGERGDSDRNSSSAGNEMVLMMGDSTPVSTSYARSEATPNPSQRASSASSAGQP